MCMNARACRRRFRRRGCQRVRVRPKVAKGVIDASFEPEQYISVDVLGKSADQVTLAAPSEQASKAAPPRSAHGCSG